TALVLVLLCDILIGSTLGIRGLLMSIVIFLVALNFLLIRNLALWQQSILIGFFTALFEFLIFCGEYLNLDVVFNPLS
ncbi:rod shape-determining protein MreD, partial [Vibrio parahaemolyticus]|nr:rod shape-determining protein MreD [Vibrio parahaemolyticus]